MTAAIWGFTALLMIAVVAVPRRYALIPFLAIAFFVPISERIAILTLDFTPFRLLVLTALVRILLRSEARAVKMTRIDKMVVAWIVVGCAIYILRWAAMKALVNRSGYTFDTIGIYVILRTFLRSWNDLDAFLKAAALCMVFFFPMIVMEYNSGSNFFVRGGHMELTHRISLREGEHRCHGPFSHPIMMGLFVVAFVPLMVGWAMTGGSKFLAFAYTAASLFIAHSTRSSTPLAYLIISLMALAAYRWRRYALAFFWASAVSMVFMHFAMEKGVFHLMARVNLISGSTGWYRYYVIDQAIRHFKDWALLGVKSTLPWGVHDLTNQYVLIGVRGGLITLVLFITLLFMCFISIGKVMKPETKGLRDILTWSVGAGLFAHCASYMAVSYFGQQILMMELLLIALCSHFAEMRAKVPVNGTSPAPVGRRRGPSPRRAGTGTPAARR